MKKVMRTLSFRNNKGKENTHQTVMVFGHANFSSVNIIDRYFTDYTYGWPATSLKVKFLQATRSDLTNQ